MDADIPTDKPPTRQALAIPGRSGRLKVTGKLRNALDAMVWQGLPRNEAAQAAGLTDHSLRAALRKQHVKRYLLDQLDVLRTSERPRNIRALVEIRDGTGNAMARVQAVKTLEMLDDREDTRTDRHVPAPGVVIVIEAGAGASAKVIEGVADRPSDDER